MGPPSRDLEEMNITALLAGNSNISCRMKETQQKRSAGFSCETVRARYCCEPREVNGANPVMKKCRPRESRELQGAPSKNILPVQELSVFPVSPELVRRSCQKKEQLL